MNDDLKLVFEQSSSITFISGKRDSGKTDLALLLLEVGKEKGLFDQIAGNVELLDDSSFRYICYMDRLKDYLQEPGRKAFILDELGKHLYKMRFMSESSRLILEICQLVRKFDAHLIGIAPNEDFVNKMFFNTDILDVFIKKLSRKKARVNNYVTRQVSYIEDIPRTSIPFRTKAIAVLELKDPNRLKEEFKEIPKDEQAARLYAKWRSLRKGSKVMGVSHTQFATYLTQYAKRTLPV